MSELLMAAVAAPFDRDLEADFARIEKLVAAARERGVRLLALPEAALGGYLATLDGSAGPPPALAPDGPEIRRLAAEAPEEVNYKMISRAFGTPKPTLANSYQPELLNLRTFPTLMGYSSRIMAESWESNTLYWAALADEAHLPPSQLNVLIPEWTQRVVERIFASHLEDWPALLKSLRIVGEDIRAKARAQLAAER